jgi:hypothetical protein
MFVRHDPRLRSDDPHQTVEQSLPSRICVTGCRAGWSGH